MAENPGHERGLLETDAVLARKRAAELDHRAEHLLARAFHLRQHIAVAEVEQDVGMQVAVAGVEDVRDRQLVVHADLTDGREDLRKPASGYDAVVQVIVGLDASQRADRALAAGPQQVALGRSLSFAHRIAVVLGEHMADCVHQLERRLCDAVDLDQKHGAGVGRIARVVVRLHRADSDAVHHLERGGDDAVTDHR